MSPLTSNITHVDDWQIASWDYNAQRKDYQSYIVDSTTSTYSLPTTYRSPGTSTTQILPTTSALPRHDRQISPVLAEMIADVKQK